MQLKKRTCNDCGGTGRLTCSHCGGHGGYSSGSRMGEYSSDHHNVPDNRTVWMTCTWCGGRRTLTCDRCHGMGYVEFYE